MNAAETPAVLRTSAQPASSNSGLRKIPPPTPVNPDSKPIAAPKPSASGRKIGRCSVGAGADGLAASRHAAKSSTSPKMIL